MDRVHRVHRVEWTQTQNKIMRKNWQWTECTECTEWTQTQNEIMRKNGNGQSAVHRVHRVDTNSK